MNTQHIGTIYWYMAFKSWYGIDVAMASYGISVTTPLAF